MKETAVLCLNHDPMLFAPAPARPGRQRGVCFSTGWQTVPHTSESRRLARTRKLDRILASLSETYCVVGVRADGSRHVLSLKLSHGDAIYLRRVLLQADIFRSVLLQRGELTPDAGDHAPAAGDEIDRGQ